MNELHTLSATEIVAAIGAGTTSAEAVAEAFLAQIQIREPDVQAWHYLDHEQVVQQARAIDAQIRANASGVETRAANGSHAATSQSRYPNISGNALCGVPIGFKDII